MNFFSRLIVSWMDREKVSIIIEDYEIRGWLYNPGLSRANRFLSDLLNRANRNFVAITNCEITHKQKQGQTEHLEFMQLNMKYIVLIKPIEDELETNAQVHFFAKMPLSKV